MHKLAEAQGWLQLCQLAVAERLTANHIPFDDFLRVLDDCLPCKIQIGDNEPIDLFAIGSIHPHLFSMSYRGPGGSNSKELVLLGGISLANARIIAE